MPNVLKFNKLVQGCDTSHDVNHMTSGTHRAVHAGNMLHDDWTLTVSSRETSTSCSEQAERSLPSSGTKGTLPHPSADLPPNRTVTDTRTLITTDVAFELAAGCRRVQINHLSFHA